MTKTTERDFDAMWDKVRNLSEALGELEEILELLNEKFNDQNEKEA